MSRRFRKWCVYRFYNAANELLYVGCSMAFISRLMNHKNDKKWFYEISRIEIFHADNPSIAYRTESDAIRSENPKYNVVGTKEHARKCRKTGLVRWYGLKKAEQIMALDE